MFNGKTQREPARKLELELTGDGAELCGWSSPTQELAELVVSWGA